MNPFILLRFQTYEKAIFLKYLICRSETEVLAIIPPRYTISFMESLEILERRIREYVDRNAKTAEQNRTLLEEVKVLREKVAALESEKESLRERVDGMIGTIEQHLGEETT